MDTLEAGAPRIASPGTPPASEHLQVAEPKLKFPAGSARKIQAQESEPCRGDV